MDPLISIITVSYNSEKTIRDTIQSVLDQSYRNIEYIIIDGASTDKTLDIIKSYEADFAVRKIPYIYFSEPDEGIYFAMNTGISKSKGELIGIINSDDWYERDAVEKIVDSYRLNAEYDIFHGCLRFVDKHGNTEAVTGHSQQVLDYGTIEHPTCFVRSKCYAEIGSYSTKFRSAADYEWMLRARHRGSKFLFHPHLIANFRRGGMSESNIGRIETLTIRKNYHIISPMKLFSWKLLFRLNDRIK